jgi:hypothetical protein
MSGGSLDRTLAILAFLAAAIVVCLIVAAAATGFSQELFQVGPAPKEVARQLTGQPLHAIGLRLSLGFDNLFVIVYCAFFAVLAARFSGLLNPTAIAVGVGALLLTGLLDAIENQHIQVMLQALQSGTSPTADELRLQMIGSNLKFHASYLGVFLLAFGFYRLGGLARVIAWLTWFGYVPLGMISFAVPVEVATPFALLRTAFFILLFALAGVYFWRRKEAPGEAA